MGGVGTGGPNLESKKEQILERFYDGATVRDVLAEFAMSENTFYSMRRRDKEWDSQIRAVTALKRGKGKHSAASASLFDPDRKLPPKGEFADWRMRYLGRPTEPIHQAIADGVLDTTNSRVIVLAPPESGKDTSVGDLLLYLKCDDMEARQVAWIMETENFSMRRVGERIRPYLESDKTYSTAPPRTPGGAKPTANLIEDYGPFKHRSGMKYPDGTPVLRTTWTKSELRFLRSSFAPEGEPDLWATGIDGQLYGSRAALMVWSDLFTRENQASPAVKEKQFGWLTLTAFSRMGGTGRLVVLGTRVGTDDNYGRLIEWLIPDGVEVHSETVDGPIITTKYTNGVCLVVCQAIYLNEDGEEQSFSPQRFPLDDYWKMPDGTVVPETEMSIDDARAQGAEKGTGLRSIRERDSATFECAYQQNPSDEAELADFTDDVLNLCKTPHLTYGQYDNRWEKILVVDPARSAGAAYVMLGLDHETGQIAVFDHYWGHHLGIHGIKQRLILDPALKWHPRYVVYEANHEQGIMFDSEVEKAISMVGATRILQHTGDKRNDPVVGIGSTSREMRQGKVLFPTMTPADQVKTRRLITQFKNWDANPKSKRNTNTRLQAPDDLAMATAIGILFCRQLIDKTKRRAQPAEPRKPVPAAVARRWKRPAMAGRKEAIRTFRGVDIVNLVLNGADE